MASAEQLNKTKLIISGTLLLSGYIALVEGGRTIRYKEYDRKSYEFVDVGDGWMDLGYITRKEWSVRYNNELLMLGGMILIITGGVVFASYNNDQSFFRYNYKF